MGCRTALVVIGVLLVGGCGGADPIGAPSTATDASSVIDGPVMRYPLPSEEDYGMAAEVKGTLELEGPCLYIAMDEVDERYPVLWPAGTSWDATAQAVVPPTGAPMPVGSAVYGGGGYMKVREVERLAGADAVALATSCVDNEFGEIAIVNNQDDAIGLVGE